MPISRRQVNSLAKSGSTKLKGDVTLTGGTNVTLTQSANNISIAATGGSGGVTGPGSSTDNAIARFDGTGGSTLQDSNLTVSDSSGGLTSLTVANGTDDLNIGTGAGNGYLNSNLIVGVATADTPVTNNNLVSFNGTDGKLIKDSTKAAPTGTIVGTSDSQALTNKDLTSGTNTFPTLNQNTTGSAAKWTTARNLAGNSVDGSANVAFANKFIVQGTSDTGLSAAQFLGSLGTGIVKNTTTTGVLSIAVAGDFPTLNQNTTGSAATLTTGRTFRTDLASTSTASFDGSANVTPGVTGTLPVGNGGTGVTSLDSLYPVGTIYTNKTNSANPSTYLLGQSGSTWVALTDVFLVARGSTYTGTGGSATHTHNLSSNAWAYFGATTSAFFRLLTAPSYNSTNSITGTIGTNTNGHTSATELGGATDSGSNIPPYQAVYTWERTA